MNENRFKVMFKMAMDWENCTRSDVRLIFMSPDHRNSEIREHVNDSVSSAVLRPWQSELFGRSTGGSQNAATPSPSSAAPSRAAGGRASTMAPAEGSSPPSSSSSNPPAPMRSTTRRTSSRVCGDLAPRARGALHTPSGDREIGTDPSGKSGNRRFFVTE